MPPTRTQEFCTLMGNGAQGSPLEPPEESQVTHSLGEPVVRVRVRVGSRGSNCYCYLRECKCFFVHASSSVSKAVFPPGTHFLSAGGPDPAGPLPHCQRAEPMTQFGPTGVLSLPSPVIGSDMSTSLKPSQSKASLAFFSYSSRGGSSE